MQFPVSVIPTFPTIVQNMTSVQITCLKGKFNTQVVNVEVSGEI